MTPIKSSSKNLFCHHLLTHVFPNLYDFISSVEKKNIFINTMFV